MNSDLIFEIVTIREGNPRKKAKISVLIFDFCHYKCGPKDIHKRTRNDDVSRKILSA